MLHDKPIGGKISGKDALRGGHAEASGGLKVNPRLMRLLADEPLRGVIDLPVTYWLTDPEDNINWVVN